MDKKLIFTLTILFLFCSCSKDLKKNQDISKIKPLKVDLQNFQFYYSKKVEVSDNGKFSLLPVVKKGLKTKSFYKIIKNKNTCTDDMLSGLSISPDTGEIQGEFTGSGSGKCVLTVQGFSVESDLNAEKTFKIDLAELMLNGSNEFYANIPFSKEDEYTLEETSEIELHGENLGYSNISSPSGSNDFFTNYSRKISIDGFRDGSWKVELDASSTFNDINGLSFRLKKIRYENIIGADLEGWEITPSTNKSKFIERNIEFDLSRFKYKLNWKDGKRENELSANMNSTLSEHGFSAVYDPSVEVEYSISGLKGCDNWKETVLIDRKTGVLQGIPGVKSGDKCVVSIEAKSSDGENISKDVIIHVVSNKLPYIDAPDDLNIVEDELYNIDIGLHENSSSSDHGSLSVYSGHEDNCLNHYFDDKNAIKISNGKLNINFNDYIVDNCAIYLVHELKGDELSFKTEKNVRKKISGETYSSNLLKHESSMEIYSSISSFESINVNIKFKTLKSFNSKITLVSPDGKEIELREYEFIENELYYYDDNISYNVNVLDGSTKTDGKWKLKIEHDGNVNWVFKSWSMEFIGIESIEKRIELNILNSNDLPEWSEDGSQNEILVRNKAALISLRAIDQDKKDTISYSIVDENKSNCFSNNSWTRNLEVYSKDTKVYLLGMPSNVTKDCTVTIQAKSGEDVIQKNINLTFIDKFEWQDDFIEKKVFLRDDDKGLSDINIKVVDRNLHGEKFSPIYQIDSSDCNDNSYWEPELSIDSKTGELSGVPVEMNRDSCVLSIKAYDQVHFIYRSVKLSFIDTPYVPTWHRNISNEYNLFADSDNITVDSSVVDYNKTDVPTYKLRMDGNYCSRAIKAASNSMKESYSDSSLVNLKAISLSEDTSYPLNCKLSLYAKSGSDEITRSTNILVFPKLMWRNKVSSYNIPGDGNINIDLGAQFFKEIPEKVRNEIRYFLRNQNYCSRKLNIADLNLDEETGILTGEALSKSVINNCDIAVEAKFRGHHIKRIVTIKNLLLSWSYIFKDTDHVEGKPFVRNFSIANNEDYSSVRYNLINIDDKNACRDGWNPALAIDNQGRLSGTPEKGHLKNCFVEVEVVADGRKAIQKFFINLKEKLIWDYFPKKTFYMKNKYNNDATKLLFINKYINDTGLKGKDLAIKVLDKFKKELEIDELIDRLDLKKVKNSPFGKHYHFRQLTDNYPKDNYQVIVSLKDDNTPYMIYQYLDRNEQYEFLFSNNKFKSTYVKSNSAKLISLDRAYDIVWNDLNVSGNLLRRPIGTLETSGNKAFYRIVLNLSKPRGIWEYYIDAQSEAIVLKRDRTVRFKEKIDSLNLNNSKNIKDRIKAFSDFDIEESKRNGALIYPLKFDNETVEKSFEFDEFAIGFGRAFSIDPKTFLMERELNSIEKVDSAAHEEKFPVTLSSDYHLKGPWVQIADIEPGKNDEHIEATTTTDGVWNSLYGTHQFLETNAYYTIHKSQNYIQSLGFKGNMGIQNLSFSIDVDGVDGDNNAHYSPVDNYIALGISDIKIENSNICYAEAIGVILHEYGHAIMNSINDQWGTLNSCFFGMCFLEDDSDAIGEGFSDYWALSSRYTSSEKARLFMPFNPFPTGGINRTANAYDLKYDKKVNYGAHDYIIGTNGVKYKTDQLWSTALFIPFKILVDSGIKREDIDQIMLQSQIGLGAHIKMNDLADSIIFHAQIMKPEFPEIAAEYIKIFKHFNIIN